MNRSILLASNNAHKLLEVRAVLSDVPVEILPLSQFPNVALPPETGETLSENALIKARAACAATGQIAIGDDSGLEIDYLHGAPGVHSHRFLGEDALDAERNEKILRLLKDVPEKQRTARFRCAAAVAWMYSKNVSPAFLPDGIETYVVEGTVEGRIAHEPRGTHGFGYDPTFFLPEFNCTMAELPAEQKNRISHRARAFGRLKTRLLELLQRQM